MTAPSTPEEPRRETRTLESLAADGVVVALRDVGASLPARPFTQTLTIPLNALGEMAELRLPKGVTPRELRSVVRYVEELLLNQHPETTTTITRLRVEPEEK